MAAPSQNHVILQHRGTGNAGHAAHADAITHFGVVPHLAQVVDFHVVANGGVRQQTTVHARLHPQLESIANTNRAQVRQTVGWLSGGIIKAKALSTHHRVFVQRSVFTKLTIPTQNGMTSQTSSGTNFARAPTCDPDSRMTPSPKHAPGPLRQTGQCKHLCPNSHWGRPRRKDEHLGRNIFLGGETVRGSAAAGHHRPESKSCLRHHRRPPGPAFEAPRFPRPKPWPPRAMRFPIPQSHHPKWHALVPPVPQSFREGSPMTSACRHVASS